MVGDDDVTLVQEFIAHPDRFAEQAAGILPHIENQPFEVAKLL